ncbi:MAG: hypothetical protein V4671_30890, partial [Armatimonadota bacterium]
MTLFQSGTSDNFLQEFNSERSVLERDLNTRIVMDAMPARDPRLLGIYSDVPLPRNDAAKRLDIFAHKYGFMGVTRAPQAGLRVCVLQRCGVGTPYVPNVSMGELIQSLDNLQQIRYALFGTQRTLDFRGMVINATTSVKGGFGQPPARIRDLPEGKRKALFDVAKSVFLKDLFKIDSPHIRMRDQVVFRKNGGRIDVCLLTTRQRLTPTFLSPKEEADEVPFIAVSDFPHRVPGIRKVDPPGMVENKKVFARPWNEDNPSRMIYIFNALFSRRSILTADGRWTIKNTKPVLPTGSNDYRSVILEAIPAQIRNIANGAYFKAICSRDMPVIKGNP